MSRLKAKSIDRNRMAKKYPFIRAPKKMGIFSDKDVIIELLTLPVIPVILTVLVESRLIAPIHVPFAAEIVEMWFES